MLNARTVVAPCRLITQKRAAMCPFCKEAFVVEDAINNYITNNYTTIEHLHADVVNLNTNPDFEIRGGELTKYNGAAVEIIVPNGVTKIGGYMIESSHRMFPRGAFEGCSEITTVFIPDSVTSISERAFFDCSNLREVRLSHNLAKIGQFAFGNCIKLKEIIIPETVETIESCAFRGCHGLSKLTIQGNPSIDEDWNHKRDPEMFDFDSSSFAGCSPETIVASEDWKWKYCESFWCLHSYSQERKIGNLKYELKSIQEKTYDEKVKIKSLEQKLSSTSIFNKAARKEIKKQIEMTQNQVMKLNKRILEINESIAKYGF